MKGKKANLPPVGLGVINHTRSVSGMLSPLKPITDYKDFHVLPAKKALLSIGLTNRKQKDTVHAVALRRFYKENKGRGRRAVERSRNSRLCTGKATLKGDIGTTQEINCKKCLELIRRYSLSVCRDKALAESFSTLGW